MIAFDPSRCECRIWINAPLSAVFEGWTRADCLSRWFQHTARNFRGESTVEGRAATGDRYEWTMSHGHVSRGTYLEVLPESLVRLTFGPETGMTFTVHLDERDGGTLVRLTHENIPRDDFEAHADIKSAWTFFLTNLKAWHEHGVDLREHDPARIRAGVSNI